VFVALFTNDAKAHAPCYPVICGLSGCHTFTHYLKNIRVLWKSYWRQNVLWFSLQICLEHFSF